MSLVFECCVADVFDGLLAFLGFFRAIGLIGPKWFSNLSCDLLAHYNDPLKPLLFRQSNMLIKELFTIAHERYKICYCPLGNDLCYHSFSHLYLKIHCYICLVYVLSYSEGVKWICLDLCLGMAMG